MSIDTSTGLRVCILGASGFVGLSVCKELSGYPDVTAYAVYRTLSPHLQSLSSVRLIPVDFDYLLEHITQFKFDAVINLAFSGCHTKDESHLFFDNAEANLGLLKKLFTIVRAASAGLCLHLGSELELLISGSLGSPPIPSLHHEEVFDTYSRRLYAIQKFLQSLIISEFSTLDDSVFSVLIFAPYIVGPFNAPSSLAGMIELAVAAGTNFVPRNPCRMLRYTCAMSLTSQLIALVRSHQNRQLAFEAGMKTIRYQLTDISETTVLGFVQSYFASLSGEMTGPR